MIQIFFFSPSFEAMWRILTARYSSSLICRSNTDSSTFSSHKSSTSKSSSSKSPVATMHIQTKIKTMKNCTKWNSLHEQFWIEIIILSKNKTRHNGLFFHRHLLIWITYAWKSLSLGKTSSRLKQQKTLFSSSWKFLLCRRKK